MSTAIDATIINLGPIERIPPGEGRTFEINFRSVAVFRTRADGIHATEALCPHKQGPLADGLVGDGKVVCPLHSCKFDVTTGEAIGSSCESIRTYGVGLSESGDILLCLDREAAEAVK